MYPTIEGCPLEGTLFARTKYTACPNWPPCTPYCCYLSHRDIFNPKSHYTCRSSAVVILFLVVLMPESADAGIERNSGYRHAYWIIAKLLNNRYLLSSKKMNVRTQV